MPPELLIAGVLALLLLGLALAAVTFEWTTLIAAGMVLVGVGLLVGVPASMAYHLRLKQVCLERDEPDAKYWLDPVSLHARLTPSELSRVKPPFRVGVAAFAVIMLGCVVAVVGLVVVWGLGQALG